MKLLFTSLTDAYLQLDALEIPRNKVSSKMIKGVLTLSARCNKTTVKIEIR